MTITITTNHILKALLILSWIIFIGLCIDAGTVLFHTFFSMAQNPVGAGLFWNKADMSALYSYDKGYFFVVSIFMIIVTIFRALMFYLILRIFYNKQLSFSAPFNRHTVRFIFNIALVTLTIGIFSRSGASYAAWLEGKGVNMPDIEYLRLSGSDAWLFMSVTLFIIGHIFKKGVEIQTENDLTV